MPTEVDTEKMEDIQNSNEIWVIDFWAEWCGPCQKLGPRFEQASDEVEEVKFGKVDMEEYQELGTQNGVRALPTLVIFKEGEEVDRQSGLMSKEELVEWVSNV